MSKLGNGTFAQPLGITAGGVNYTKLTAEQQKALDYQNLKEKYSKNKVNIGDKVYLNKDFIKPWFTNSIKESFFLEDDYYRIRSEVYFPDRFLKSPFTGGFLFFTVDHQVFIYMYTT